MQAGSERTGQLRLRRAQMSIDRRRGLAPFRNRPHHQRLPAPRVACRETFAGTGRLIILRRHISARIQRPRQTAPAARFELGPVNPIASSTRSASSAYFGAARIVHRGRSEVAAPVRRPKIASSRPPTPASRPLHASSPCAIAAATIGHGVDDGALRRRHRHNFELVHRRRLLPVRRAQAIRARIAAADDHDAFARRQNLSSPSTESPPRAYSAAAENPSRNGSPFSSRPGTAQIARLLRARSPAPPRRNRARRSSIGTSGPTERGDELDAFGRSSAPRAGRSQCFSILKSGNAVAQQSADAVAFLEHRHRSVPRAPIAAPPPARPDPSRSPPLVFPFASPAAPARIQPCSNA